MELLFFKKINYFTSTSSHITIILFKVVQIGQQVINDISFLFSLIFIIHNLFNSIKHFKVASTSDIALCAHKKYSQKSLL